MHNYFLFIYLIEQTVTTAVGEVKAFLLMVDGNNNYHYPPCLLVILK